MTNYINRTLETTLRHCNTQFKIVLVTGPHQVGKTCLLKHCGADRRYVSVYGINEREWARRDPELFLQHFGAPLIIDDIQYAPQLMPYLKRLVDSCEATGRYWLAGSQHFALMKGISESLAGRVAVLTLQGLSAAELRGLSSPQPFLPNKEFIKSRRQLCKTQPKLRPFEQIVRGSYPALHSTSNTDIYTFYNSYVTTYLERDLRLLEYVADESSFMKFLCIVAARTAQTVNYSEIAQAAEISQPTAKKWLSLLVRSQLVYLVQPWYRNVSKRLIKMPKLYFADTGLCAFLSGWESARALEVGSMSSAFFETYVATEIIKSYQHAGRRAPIYYYRDLERKEIGLLIERDGQICPIEIKQTASPQISMVKNFKLLENSGPGALICSVSEDLPLTQEVTALPVTYL
ncbi:MAG: ATP-binding protein [Succinivibrio sp.]|nr:ATP-binding protein [Succinivibrio sp.]